MKSYKSLSCVVVTEKKNKDAKKRQWSRSEGRISLGPLLVAIGVYSGKSPTEQEVLEDFKRNPHNKGRFTLHAGYDSAKALGLCG